MNSEDYIWPVSRKETVKVAQALIDRLPTVLNKIYSKRSLSSRCVMNASGRFSIDAISLIIAESIKSRVSPDALTSPNLRKSPFLISDNDPKETFNVFTIKILRNGLVKPPAWKEQLRPLKSVLLRDGYNRQKIERLNLENDIVAVSSQPLIHFFAAIESRRINLGNIRHWFPKPSHTLIKTIQHELDSAEDIAMILSVMEESAATIGTSLSALGRRAFTNFLNEILVLTGAYLSQLDGGIYPIPKHLWAGSSGIIWIRMLEDAVIRSGGVVTGFDHAEGANFDTNNKFAFVELQTVNKFVTFGKKTAENITKASKKYCFTGLKPEIIFPQHVLPTSIKKLKRQENVNEIETVLFLPPFISISQQGLYPPLGPEEGLSFIREVLRITAKRQLKVKMKIHPEQEFINPNLTEGMNHVELISSGRSEDFFEQVDALIIDYSAQSSFGSALRTNIPILFLDTGQIEFNEEVRDHLSSRVGYVKVEQINIREWVIQEQDFERVTREAIKKKQSNKFLRFVST